MSKGTLAAELIGARDLERIQADLVRRSQYRLAWPLLVISAFAALGLVPVVRENPRLLWSVWGAAACLAGWLAWLAANTGTRGRTLQFIYDFPPQHYHPARAPDPFL